MCFSPFFISTHKSQKSYPLRKCKLYDDSSNSFLFMSTKATPVTDFNTSISSISILASNSVETFQKSIASTGSEIKYFVKTPSRIFNNLLTEMKLAVDKYYEFQESIDNEKLKQKEMETKRLQDIAYRRENNPINSLLNSYELLKEFIYQTGDSINNLALDVKKNIFILKDAIIFIKDLPVTSSKVLDETSTKLSMIVINIQETQSKIEETSKYVWRVITLEEARKSYSELSLRTKNIYDKLKTDPLSLIFDRSSYSSKKSTRTASKSNIFKTTASILRTSSKVIENTSNLMKDMKTFEPIKRKDYNREQSVQAPKPGKWFTEIIGIAATKEIERPPGTRNSSVIENDVKFNAIVAVKDKGEITVVPTNISQSNAFESIVEINSDDKLNSESDNLSVRSADIVVPAQTSISDPSNVKPADIAIPTETSISDLSVGSLPNVDSVNSVDSIGIPNISYDSSSNLSHLNEDTPDQNNN